MLSPLLIGEEKQGQGMPEGQGDGKRQVSRLAEAGGENNSIGRLKNRGNAKDTLPLNLAS